MWIRWIALTEHFNTKNFHEVYDTLDAHFPYEDGYYNVFGLKVFPGMEVDILEVGHILMYRGFKGCAGNA